MESSFLTRSSPDTTGLAGPLPVTPAALWLTWKMSPKSAPCWETQLLLLSVYTVLA